MNTKNKMGENLKKYRERYPKAAEAWNTYVRNRRASESREHILAGVLLKTQDA